MELRQLRVCRVRHERRGEPVHRNFDARQVAQDPRQALERRRPDAALTASAARRGRRGRRLQGPSPQSRGGAASSGLSLRPGAAVRLRPARGRSSPGREDLGVMRFSQRSAPRQRRRGRLRLPGWRRSHADDRCTPWTCPAHGGRSGGGRGERDDADGERRYQPRLHHCSSASRPQAPDEAEPTGPGVERLPASAAIT